jgi:bleomycin hydrolase
VATEMEVTASISPALLMGWNEMVARQPLRRVISNAIVKNGIQAVAQDRRRVSEMTFSFSHEIPTGAVTNQKQSGRCWLFAGLNLMRESMAKALKMKDFELSQAYLMFYDKLEKANYFLENIVATRHEALDSRLVSWLLSAPVQDGGQWDMFVNLVEKYGVVPHWVMPESFHSSESRFMNRLLTTKLREDAARLRESTAHADQLRDQKNAMMADIYLLLVEFLGEPPSRFDFEYQNDDGEFFGERDLTSTAFYQKYSRLHLDNLVSVINAPTPDKPFIRAYTVDYLGNVVGGRPILYLNVPIERFKEMALHEIVADRPVWFGCDVGPMSDRALGILDTDQYDYGTTLGVDFSLTKAERLMFGESQMTHAMLLTGVNVVQGRPDRWKVENSWGTSNGHNGFFVMSDSWFDQFMYQIVVDSSRLTDAERAALDTEPVHLPPWDPMGALA